MKRIACWLIITATGLLAGCSGQANEQEVEQTLESETTQSEEQSVDSAIQQNASTDLGVEQPENDADTLSVYFFSAGKADAAVMVAEDGSAVMIDTGLNKNGEQLVSRMREIGVKKLDYLIISHPHKDHIGGADYVIEAFPVEKALVSALRVDSKQERQFDEAIEQYQIPVEEPEINRTYQWKGVTLTVLGPLGSGYEDENDYSLIIRAEYQGTRILFTGDAEKQSLKEMLSAVVDLSADILKVPHHGKAEDNSGTFIQAVSPDVAVIPCVEGTDKELPEQELMDILQQAGCQSFITGRGDVLLQINNGTITVEQLNTSAVAQ